MRPLKRALAMAGNGDEHVREVVELLTRPAPAGCPSLDEILQERHWHKSLRDAEKRSSLERYGAIV